MIKNFLTPFFWIDLMPDPMIYNNLYGAAFATGRSIQMGIDPAALEKALKGLEAGDVEKAATELFSRERQAAVVVQPAKRE